MSEAARRVLAAFGYVLVAVGLIGLLYVVRDTVLLPILLFLVTVFIVIGISFFAFLAF